MTALVTLHPSLPALVDRAVQALQGARTSAEVLDAHDLATVAYDAAKKTARFLKARGAHDDLITAAYRAQADALEIECAAKIRLANEYDDAQERGEVATDGRPKTVPVGNGIPATASELGITRKSIHEARTLRAAEEADPGIIGNTLKQSLSSGAPPSRAKLNRAVKATAPPKAQPKPKRRRRHARLDATPSTETQHDRDLQMLMGMWNASCESAQAEFLKTITDQQKGV